MRWLVLFIALLAVGPASAQETATPWIGIGIAAGTRGVAVNQVIENTPGARAGLAVGDEVLAIDGTAVGEATELIRRVRAKGVGTKVTLTVLRGAKTMKVTLALEARPDQLELLRSHLVGKPAPALALSESNGPFPARLEALSGHVVVVEFWATWCGPCNSTLPILSTWQQKYGPRGLRILGISTEPLATVAAHAAAKKVGYTVAHDDGAVSDAYRIPAIPTLVVIDRHGVIRYADVGAGEKLAEVERVVLKLLETDAR